ncbi:MAG: hypothetical protein CVU09_02440 [Bacteroidetes bacterium HGW-Bacteroidetes-4]|jgi:hypothetical protein|nr:MAG: hypothetical protein CVU09_02440 [Bacteroidetes bacterium HGW-Bacteroidetes-4]
MKKNLMYLMLFFLGGLFVSSCDKDNEDPIIIDNPVYGMQVIGSATGDEAVVIDAKQMVEPSSDFATKVVREGMYYQIAYLSAGDIMFKEVTATGEVTYGATEVGDSIQEAEAGAPFSYKTGKLVLDGTETLAIAEAGLYYIMTDATTSLFWLMKIDNFEINATGDLATMVGTGSADGVNFEVKAVDLRSVFKVRINTAWKFITTNVPWTDLAAGGAEGDHCRPVISYGGAANALTADGADISIDNGGQLLDFTFTWTPGKKGIAGITVTTAPAGELPPAEFPEAMFMIGASIGGWDWAANGIEMVPVHSNPHLFWKIVWVEAGVADAGFKFSPEKAWGKDFGVDAATGATDGVYGKGVDNVPDVAESGYYMVVVNLETETIEVNTPSVNGINAVFGDPDWAGNVEFTVDNTNKVITSPAFSTDGALRMYVKANTLTNADGAAIDWWQAEFNVFDGVIEYRGTGNDQAAVNVTAGQTVSLNFANETGVIE